MDRRDLSERKRPKVQADRLDYVELGETKADLPAQEIEDIRSYGQWGDDGGNNLD